MSGEVGRRRSRRIAEATPGLPESVQLASLFYAKPRGDKAGAAGGDRAFRLHGRSLRVLHSAPNVYLVEDFPAYGLAPNGALAEASRRLLVERRVCEDTWCARRSLRGAAGRRRACVLPDAVPTERLVAILPPRSRAACPIVSSLR